MTMLSKLSRFSWTMFAATLLLIACGTIAIKSAGAARADAVFHTMWESNLWTAAVGLALYFALAFADYRKIVKWCAMPAYVVAVAMLAAVLAFGTSRFGGRRWLWFFQPSEVAKLCVIALVARLASSSRLPLGLVKERFSGFALLSLVVALPIALILLEPDLGTALVLVPAVVMVFFTGGVWRTGLVALLSAGAVTAALVLGAVHEAEKPGVAPERREAILRFVPLREHQVRRVKVFLFPDEDIHDSGYTLRQAKISIGSGGLSGKGIGKGESNHLKYLPQAISMNDFIFCVWAEETGFIGSAALLALFALVILPGVFVAYRAEDGTGRLLALGLTTLFFAHVFINIAMSLGLVPITGLPLPFISSGRTFLVTMMASLGMVQSVSIYGGSSAVQEYPQNNERT